MQTAITYMTYTNKSRSDTGKLSYTCKVSKNGKKLWRYQTRSKRRFYGRLRTIDWTENEIKVYVRVNYGKHLSVFGKYEYFWNDGEYSNERDLWMALDAFCEND